MQDGGTLVAIGTAVQTARQLLDLPIESVLPRRDGRGGGQQEQLNRRPGGVDPTSVFYSPGSLLGSLWLLGDEFLRDQLTRLPTRP